MNRFRLGIIAATMLFGACAAEKSYVNYADWDSDEDQQLGKAEFINAYVNSGFFNKWASGRASIGYTDLYHTVYRSIDSDSNMVISQNEFRGMRRFYFGMFNNSFSEWDDDSGNTISLGEFNTHIASSNIASLWDADSDKYISEREMAAGMFYQCDLNNNGTIDQAEFNLWKHLR